MTVTCCRCRSGAGVELSRFVQLPLIRSWDDIDFTVVMLNCLIFIKPPVFDADEAEANLITASRKHHPHVNIDRSLSQFEVITDISLDPESIEEFQSRLDDADFLAIFEQFPISALLSHSFQSLFHPSMVPDQQTVLRLFSFVNHLIRLLSRTFNDQLKSKFAVVTQFVARQISEVR